MNDNKATLTGKVKRYANVSSKITSIAARMAGNKIICNNDINKNADNILKETTKQITREIKEKNEVFLEDLKKKERESEKRIDFRQKKCFKKSKITK